MASVFFSYSHKDEALRDQIETQLSSLKRRGVIDVWHDRRIGPGEEFAAVIDHQIETDDIILLLVSADFIASDYCYEIEMKRALERHEAGEAIVIPVILRACDWHDEPFGKLNATPPDGKPITQYADRDQAFLEVAKAVKDAAMKLAKTAPTQPAVNLTKQMTGMPAMVSMAEPRSSNLRLAKTFTDRDKDKFKHETFEYIARYFENSLSELEARNEGIEGEFRRIDANSFTAAVYKDGKSASQCAISMGGHSMMDGITYSNSSSFAGNGFNEILSVDADENSMFIKSMGMLNMVGGKRDEKLTQQGAAELYWSSLIRVLQQG